MAVDALLLPSAVGRQQIFASQRCAGATDVLTVFSRGIKTFSLFLCGLERGVGALR